VAFISWYRYRPSAALTSTRRILDQLQNGLRRRWEGALWVCFSFNMSSSPNFVCGHNCCKCSTGLQRLYIRRPLESYGHSNFFALGLGSCIFPFKDKSPWVDDFGHVRWVLHQTSHSWRLHRILQIRLQEIKFRATTTRFQNLSFCSNFPLLLHPSQQNSPIPLSSSNSFNFIVPVFNSRTYVSPYLTTSIYELTCMY